MKNTLTDKRWCGWVAFIFCSLVAKHLSSKRENLFNILKFHKDFSKEFFFIPGETVEDSKSGNDSLNVVDDENEPLNVGDENEPLNVGDENEPLNVGDENEPLNVVDVSSDDISDPFYDANSILAPKTNHSATFCDSAMEVESDADSEASLILPTQAPSTSSTPDKKVVNVDNLRRKKVVNVDKLRRKKIVNVDKLRCNKVDREKLPIPTTKTFQMPKPNLYLILRQESTFTLPKEYTGLKLEYARTQAILGNGSSSRKRKARKGLNPGESQLSNSGDCQISSVLVHNPTPAESQHCFNSVRNSSDVLLSSDPSETDQGSKGDRNSLDYVLSSQEPASLPRTAKRKRGGRRSTKKRPKLEKLEVIQEEESENLASHSGETIAKLKTELKTENVASHEVVDRLRKEEGSDNSSEENDGVVHQVKGENEGSGNLACHSSHESSKTVEPKIDLKLLSHGLSESAHESPIKHGEVLFSSQSPVGTKSLRRRLNKRKSTLKKSNRLNVEQTSTLETSNRLNVEQTSSLDSSIVVLTQASSTTPELIDM